ncbi:MAG: hypothetical protein ABIQ16_07205, partial [Polyangiaceae bacterium]
MLPRNASRWTFYLTLAGALHCTALLCRGCVQSAKVLPALTIENPLDAIEVQLLQDLSPAPGPAPGGGSIEPRPGPRTSAPEQRVKPTTQARFVDRAPKRQEDIESGERTQDTVFPQPFLSDLLSSDEADAPDEVRP